MDNCRKYGDLIGFRLGGPRPIYRMVPNSCFSVSTCGKGVRSDRRQLARLRGNCTDEGIPPLLTKKSFESVRWYWPRKQVTLGIMTFKRSKLFSLRLVFNPFRDYVHA